LLSKLIVGVLGIQIPLYPEEVDVFGIITSDVALLSTTTPFSSVSSPFIFVSGSKLPYSVLRTILV